MISSELINTEWAPKAEKLGQLTSEMLDLIYNEKWFKIFVPRELGGMGLTLPEALELEEIVAQLDASLGWTVTLCAGAGWFVGFMDENLSHEIFSDPKVCLSGSGFVGGVANRIGDAYQIDGSWTYASGALHATHFTANCEVLEDGIPLLDTHGKPVIKAFILKREEVMILGGWNYMGMLATGSHAFRCEDQMIPINRSFEILPELVTRLEPVYRYPFLQFAETTLAVNLLGISQHLQRLISQAFWNRNAYKGYDQKHKNYFSKIEKTSRCKIESYRKMFYDQVGLSWEELEKNGRITTKTLKSVSHLSRKLTQTCRDVNARMYPFAGLEAAKTETELNRVWRDFNTVSQHALLTFPF